jgi:hypothetical protein
VDTTAANRTTATNLIFFLIVHLLGADVTMPVQVSVELSTDAGGSKRHARPLALRVASVVSSRGCVAPEPSPHHSDGYTRSW